MALIGIISDSHENRDAIQKAVTLFNERKVSVMLHAGDIISPMAAEYLKKTKAMFYAVFGNNDGERFVWRQLVNGWGQIFERYFETTIDGKKILLMHEPYNLQSLVKSQEYDVLIYGHTHKVDNRIVGKTLVLNPGENCGFQTGKCTAALLDTDTLKAEIVEL